MDVLVIDETAAGEAGSVDVRAGGRVPVTKEAPGVRKTLIQAGCVKMAGSRGCTNSFGVRKESLSSRRDSISVSKRQFGEKRNASCPAAMTEMNPITKMMMTMIQSFRSCSTILMFIDWQSHIYRCARICRFVMPGALQPDAPVVCIDNPACNGEPEPGSSAFEFGLAGGMQKNFAGLIELFKDKLLVFQVDANTAVLNGDLDFSPGTISDRPPGD